MRIYIYIKSLKETTKDVQRKKKSGYYVQILVGKESKNSPVTHTTHRYRIPSCSLSPLSCTSRSDKHETKAKKDNKKNKKNYCSKMYRVSSSSIIL